MPYEVDRSSMESYEVDRSVMAYEVHGNIEEPYEVDRSVMAYEVHGNIGEPYEVDRSGVELAIALLFCSIRIPPFSSGSL
jgi:hypothetical protein